MEDSPSSMERAEDVVMQEMDKENDMDMAIVQADEQATPIDNMTPPQTLMPLLPQQVAPPVLPQTSMYLKLYAT